MSVLAMIQKYKGNSVDGPAYSKSFSSKDAMFAWIRYQKGDVYPEVKLLSYTEVHAVSDNAKGTIPIPTI